MSVAAEMPALEAAAPSYPAAEPLMTIGASGSGLRSFLVVPGYEHYGSPMWSRDGAKLAFDARPANSSPELTHIFVANADGGEIRDLGVGLAPSWSPNDRRIAFHRVDRQMGIWAINADGTSAERLTTNGIAARWSHEGTEIAYIDSPGATGPVYGNHWGGYGVRSPQAGRTSSPFYGMSVFDTIDGGQRPLVLNYPHNYHLGFQWSPDGNRLAFVGGLDDMSKELVIVSGRGKDQRLSVRLAGDRHSLGTHVCWCSDGKRLLVEYGGRLNVPRQLYFVEVDSDKPPVLVPGQDPKRYSGDMALSPDAKRIVFASFAP